MSNTSLDLEIIEKYYTLYESIFVLLSFYMIYLLFFVNSKSQRINKKNKLALIRKSASEKKEINENFESERIQLINSSKKLMFFFLLLDLIVNIVLIIKKEYFDIIGIIGGILLPFLVYLFFVFILITAIGLKGQSVIPAFKYNRKIYFK